MAWSYSCNPGTSPKDNVRFILGDTNEKDQLLHDEEIAYMLVQNRLNPYAAALDGCQAIMAKLSRSTDESVGSVSIHFSQRLAGYEKLLATLKRRQAFSGNIRPYSGGISRSDKRRLESDRDATRPQFRASSERRERQDWLWAPAFDGQVYDAGGVDGLTYGGDGISSREIAVGATDTGEPIRTGTTDPTSSTPGAPGDYYFNLTTKTLFGPYQ